MGVERSFSPTPARLGDDRDGSTEYQSLAVADYRDLPTRRSRRRLDRSRAAHTAGSSPLGDKSGVFLISSPTSTRVSDLDTRQNCYARTDFLAHSHYDSVQHQ